MYFLGAWSKCNLWLAISGTVIYVFAMWNSGITQGLMWRTYTESDTLRYSFVDSLVAMHPYYIARAFGGLLFLIGACVGLYNVLMTIRRVPYGAATLDYPDATVRGVGTGRAAAE